MLANTQIAVVPRLDTNAAFLQNFNLAQLLTGSTNCFDIFTRCLHCKYKTLPKFPCILAVIKELKLYHEKHDILVEW